MRERTIRIQAAILAALLGGCREAPKAPPPAPAAPPAAVAPAPATDPAPAPPPKLDKPLLWEISGPGGASYLLGTMHTGFSAVTDTHPIVWEKFKASSAFLAEIDLFSPDLLEVQRRALLPEGGSLSAMLGQEAFEKLSKALPSTPPAFLDRFQPWFALISMTLEAYPKSVPMDSVFLSEAKKAGKALAFLETPTAQLDMLTKAMSVELLKESLAREDPMARVREQAKKLTDAYVSGDPEALARVVAEDEDAKKHPELQEELLTARNKRWVPLLKPHVDKGGAFIAVGAAHLIGDEGLLALLEKEGYRVTRVAPGGR
jgi:uncharacterized protein